jgi:hypothetical protein
MGQTREQMLAEALARVNAPGELVPFVAEALGVPESVAEYAIDEALCEPGESAGLQENLMAMAVIHQLAKSAAKRPADSALSDRSWKSRTKYNDLERKHKNARKAASGRSLSFVGKGSEGEAKKVLSRYDRFKRHMGVKHVAGKARELAGKISSAAKRGMKMVFGKWQKVEAAEMRRELRRLESTPSPFPEARERRVEQLREDLKEWDPGAYKNSAPPAGSIIIDKGSYTGWVSKTGFYLEYDDLDHVLEAKSKQDAAKLYAIVSKDKKAFADIWKHEQHSTDPSKRKPGMREWLESKGIDYYFNKGYH